MVQVATYTYDVLNRVSQVIYSKERRRRARPRSSPTIAAPTPTRGRLRAPITDPAAVTSWTYNSRGRVASKAQQVGSIIRSVASVGNAAGQLTTMTTPSGQQIDYGSSQQSRSSSVTINGQSLLHGS